MTLTQERPTWARSAISDLKECHRKFYLGRVSKNEHAQSLKKIKNRYLWSGAMVHDVIGDAIQLLRQGSPVPPAAELIETVKNKMRDEFKASKDSTQMESQLFEHAYGIQLSNELWKKNWETVQTSLQWFFDSSWFKRIREMKPENWKLVNEVVDFDVDGIKAYAKLDCALEKDGRFILIDWKTGPIRARDEESIMLAALYAHEVWDAHPENTDAFIVSLTEGRHQQVTIEEEKLMETFLKIQEGAEMISTAAESWTPETDPMSINKTEEISNCFRCNFQKICYPSGMGGVDAI